MDARSYLSNNVRYEILGKPALPANFWATAVSISVSVMLSRPFSSFGGLQQHRMRRRHNAKKQKQEAKTGTHVPQQAPQSVVSTVIGNATLYTKAWGFRIRKMRAVRVG